MYEPRSAQSPHGGILVNLTTTRGLAYLQIGLGAAVLMVEGLGYDPRIGLGGVSLNQAVFFVGGIASAFTRLDIRQLRYLIQACVVILLSLGFTLLWSQNPAYGAEKLTNLCLPTVIAGVLFLGGVRELGLATVLRVISIGIVLIFAAALLYKAKYGFWNRDVHFLFNGPIV